MPCSLWSCTQSIQIFTQIIATRLLGPSNWEGPRRWKWQTDCQLPNGKQIIWVAKSLRDRGDLYPEACQFAVLFCYDVCIHQVPGGKMDRQADRYIMYKLKKKNIHSPFTCKSAINYIYMLHLLSNRRGTLKLIPLRKKHHPLVFVGSVSPTWSCSLYGNLTGAETPERWVSMGLCNF